MISTNRIFESAHGPKIPNFLEIVAGLYSIGLPRRLINYLPRDGSLTSSGRPILGKLTKNFSKMSNPVGKLNTPLPLGQTIDWCITRGNCF